jgi:hypothetical protein
MVLIMVGEEFRLFKQRALNIFARFFLERVAMRFIDSAGTYTIPRSSSFVCILP